MLKPPLCGWHWGTCPCGPGLPDALSSQGRLQGMSLLRAEPGGAHLPTRVRPNHAWLCLHVLCAQFPAQRFRRCGAGRGHPSPCVPTDTGQRAALRLRIKGQEQVAGSSVLNK